MFLFSQKLKYLRKKGPIYGRQSPLHGDHTAIPPSRLSQSIPISIPLAPRSSEGPQKRSLEGLNSEIQKIVLTDTQVERVSSCHTCTSVGIWLTPEQLYRLFFLCVFYALIMSQNILLVCNNSNNNHEYVHV